MGVRTSDTLRESEIETIRSLRSKRVSKEFILEGISYRY